MSTLSKLFRVWAARMPRVRGFGSRFYFGHPFLDAWFAWFPLNQIQYDGAAVGEIYNVASRIDERKSEYREIFLQCPIKLTPLSGNISAEIALCPHQLLVGRNPICDIVLSSPRVSRHHFLMYTIERGLYVEDL